MRFASASWAAPRPAEIVAPTESGTCNASAALVDRTPDGALDVEPLEHVDQLLDERPHRLGKRRRREQLFGRLAQLDDPGDHLLARLLEPRSLDRRGHLVDRRPERLERVGDTLEDALRLAGDRVDRRADVVQCAADVVEDAADRLLRLLELLPHRPAEVGRGQRPRHGGDRLARRPRGCAEVGALDRLSRLVDEVGQLLSQVAERQLGEEAPHPLGELLDLTVDLGADEQPRTLLEAVEELRHDREQRRDVGALHEHAGLDELAAPALEELEHALLRAVEDAADLREGAERLVHGEPVDQRRDAEQLAAQGRDRCGADALEVAERALERTCIERDGSRGDRVEGGDQAARALQGDADGVEPAGHAVEAGAHPLDGRGREGQQDAEREVREVGRVGRDALLDGLDETAEADELAARDAQRAVGDPAWRSPPAARASSRGGAQRAARRPRRRTAARASPPPPAPPPRTRPAAATRGRTSRSGHRRRRPAAAAAPQGSRSPGSARATRRGRRAPSAPHRLREWMSARARRSRRRSGPARRRRPRGRGSPGPRAGSPRVPQGQRPELDGEEQVARERRRLGSERRRSGARRRPRTRRPRRRWRSSCRRGSAAARPDRDRARPRVRPGSRPPPRGSGRSSRGR